MGNKQQTSSAPPQKELPATTTTTTTPPGECPGPDELGNAGWTILHTTAAVYPNNPTPNQQRHFEQFISSWSFMYACSHCSYHMRQMLQRNPPNAGSANKRAASRYICELHNEVNKMLLKDEYDCDPNVVLKRWHPMYPDVDTDPVSVEEQVAALLGPTKSSTSTSSSGASGKQWRSWNDQGSHSSSSSGKDVADGETDPEAVMRRLKSCQVYCPEKKTDI